MCKIISSPDAATGKTTAKKMTKTEINEDKMFAIRERIEKNVKPLAEMHFKFENSVNEITFKEAGVGEIIMTPRFIMKDIFYGLCDKVMLSRMSSDEKLDVLNKLDLLVNYVRNGAMLSVMSKDEKEWNKTVRCIADQSMAYHKKRCEK